MKRFLYILMALAVAASASARVNLVSVNNNKAAVASGQNKADAIYESVSREYARGKISADSVVSLAMYHKVWSRDLAERCLRLVANERNPRAETELGVLYVFSPGSKHVDEGLKLLNTAAQTGDNKAKACLGYYYYQHKDYARAKSYLDAVPPMSQSIGNVTLGSMYLEGKGVRKDGKKARENYSQAANLGLSRGMLLYASLLGTKNGGPVNYPDAFFWHYIAGELGENLSRVMLYRPQVPVAAATDSVERDAQSAISWIETVHTGKRLSSEPIYKDGFLKGLESREQAAERGDDWSRFYLGSMNYNGDFLNQNYARALNYYEPIARNGRLPRPILALVHERLADMYRTGKGTSPNPSAAARHTRLAAQYGSLPAYKQVENVQ